MEEATNLCSNCQRPIAASNFVIHSLHCQRNLTKCVKCGEAVPRAALDEHEQEFHLRVNCPDCHMSVEKHLLDTHKKAACRSRKQGCLFCELEMPACEISDHENYCGSRTKKCEDCGEYVMLKYEQLHIDSDHRFLKLDDEPGPTATWIKNDIDSTSRPAKSNNNKKPQLTTGKFDIDEEDDDMYSLFANLMKKKTVSTTPNYPGVAYPIGGGPQRLVSRSPPSYQDVQGGTSDLVALPCEFCEAMIPFNQLIQHQKWCQTEFTCYGKTKKSQNDTFKKTNHTTFNEVDGGDVGGGSEKLNDALDDWKDYFQQNADVFDKDYSIQENADVFDVQDVRRNAVPYVDKLNVDRQRIDRTGSSIDMRRNAIDEGSDASLKEDLDDEGIYLPCEFCQEGYPPSLLLEHQDVCEYHPKNVTEAAPVQKESQDAPLGRSKDPIESLRTRKFDESNHNTYVDLDQPYSNMIEESSINVHVPQVLENSPRHCDIVCRGSGIPLDIPVIVDKQSSIKILTSNKYLDTEGKQMPIYLKTDCEEFAGTSCDGKKVSGNTMLGSKCFQAKIPSATSVAIDCNKKSDGKDDCYPGKVSSYKIGSRRPFQKPQNSVPQVVTFSPRIVVSPPHDSDSRGKSNISNSHNDLRGNFTVASEWSDDSDSRPTSATGAIPKQKAGKTNFARKVNQEVSGSRPSNSIVPSNSRKVNDRGSTNGDHSQGFHIRNNLKDDDNDDS